MESEVVSGLGRSYCRFWIRNWIGETRLLNTLHSTVNGLEAHFKRLEKQKLSLFYLHGQFSFFRGYRMPAIRIAFLLSIRAARTVDHGLVAPPHGRMFHHPHHGSTFHDGILLFLQVGM